MVPEVVVFDLGKVLLDFDYDLAVARILQRCHITAADLRQLINQSPLLFRYETNLLSTQEFFDEIRTASGFAGDLAEFSEMFSDIFTPIEPMVRLHQELRSRRVPTYIFSNTNHLAVGHIRERYAFFREFDGYVLSCEHGAMKPDHKLYEVVEKQTGRRGPQLLYIDDRHENFVAGNERGWQAIWHQSPEVTIETVRKTGILGSA